MILANVSMVSGALNVMDLPVTLPQYLAWKGGESAEQAIPRLTPAERDFLIWGLTEAESLEVEANAAAARAGVAAKA